MQNYLSQLLNDLKQAEINPVPDIDYGTTQEEFNEAMHKIEESRPQPAKDIIGVSFEELPAPEMLTNNQMETLIDAIGKALKAKGTSLSFPSGNAPVSVKYRELKNLFLEGFHPLPGWVQDFCCGWCPGCGFVDYCEGVADCWTKEELEEEQRKMNDDV